MTKTYRYAVTGDFSRMIYSRHITRAAAERACRALARKWGWSHPGSEPRVIEGLAHDRPTEIIRYHVTMRHGTTYTYQINPDTLGDCNEADQAQFVAACNREARKQDLPCRFELGDVFADSANRSELDPEQVEEARTLSNDVWDSDW